MNGSSTEKTPAALVATAACGRDAPKRSGTDRRDTAEPSAVFRLPDVNLPFGPPPPRHDGERLRQHTCDWALDHGLIGLRGHARMSGSELLDVGIALTGDAPFERARVLMEWFVWVLVLDDLVDDGQWARAGTLDDFVEAARGILGRGTPRAHEDPMLRTLADDLWPRTRRLGDAVWQVGIADHLVRHLHGQRQIIALRAAGREPTLAAYPELRADLFGIDVLFDLIQAVHGVESPSSERFVQAVRRLRSCAADVVIWTNDLYSLEKDLLLGESANLVKIVHREHGGGWQQAVDTVHAMICGRAEDFLAARRELDVLHRHRRGTSELAPAIAMADRLQATMAAAVSWYRSAGRYHWQRPSGSAGELDAARTPPSLVWARFERDPYPLYDRLRREFPLMRDEPLDMWVVSRYDDVRAALRDPALSSDSYAWQTGALVGRTLLEMDGGEHTAHRALMSPAFRGRAIAALRETAFTTAAELARSAARQIRSRGHTDLITSFCRDLPIRVMTAVLGLPEHDIDILRPWYKAGFAYMSDHRQDPATLQRGLAARDDLYAYLAPQVATRRARPTGDLLSALCTERVDGEPLTDDQVKGSCAVLLAAGADTTDRALSFFLANLLDNPDALAELRADPALVDLAWAESLRRDPPTQIVVRRTTRAVDLPSGRLPADATVACVLAAANRDPARFPDPDRYDLHRAGATGGNAREGSREFAASAEHLAFGAGRHFCLGAHLARLLGQTVPTLLAAVPGLRWADGFTPAETGLISRGPVSLLVTTER
ncbi:cytochrome P450 [Actinomadura hibisca]|uniref:cytochrome P450 n=1 Tax=Actinomadura hibisca TaxID=68565 RepID=UPI000A025BCF|nr:cytochrome P450 [Actinomadura hibisca]